MLKTGKGMKVSYLIYLLIINAAWEMLAKKMNLLNLSEAEQEMIKQDILHKEAEINRKMRKKITVRDFDFNGVMGPAPATGETDG